MGHSLTTEAIGTSKKSLIGIIFEVPIFHLQSSLIYAWDVKCGFVSLYIANLLNCLMSDDMTMCKVLMPGDQL